MDIIPDESGSFYVFDRVYNDSYCIYNIYDGFVFRCTS